VPAQVPGGVARAGRGRRARRARRVELGGVAAFLERVEDEVEAVLERGREVVADFGDVPGDDFGEVGKLLGQCGGLPLLRVLGELPDLLLGDRCAFLRVVERQVLLLEGEAVFAFKAEDLYRAAAGTDPALTAAGAWWPL